MRNRRDMFAQKISSKVSVEIAPDGMDMVPIVLAVVMFNEERGALNSIVVFLAALSLSRPRESEFVHTGLLDLRLSICRDVVGHLRRVNIDNLDQHFALLRIHGISGKAYR